MVKNDMDLFDELRTFKGIDGTSLDPVRLTTLRAVLTETLGTRHTPVLKNRFRSRKNVVVHLQMPDDASHPHELVAKLFVTGSYEKELQILRKSLAHGLNVPAVLAAQNGVILTAYIPGEPLVDTINRTFDSATIDSLALWYHSYHTIHGEIKGDPRLRNFIWSNGQVYGVDFEESRPDHWITDIAGAAASLLDTDPIFDERKRALAWRFFKTYLSLRCSDCDPAINRLFIDTVADTLEVTANQRNDERILTLAKTIRTDEF
jgi:tRNA A-37 threonylcarbamoyl transferase component Bud32